MDVADAINVMLYASDRPSQAAHAPKAEIVDKAPSGIAEKAVGDHAIPMDSVGRTDDSGLRNDFPLQDGVNPQSPRTVGPSGIDAKDIQMNGEHEPREPGCAVWDIFRAEDANKIRQFLSDRYGDTQDFTDPIHSQLFFLDAELRRQLWDKHGVVSWRIYQYPVRNLSPIS